MAPLFIGKTLLRSGIFQGSWFQMSLGAFVLICSLASAVLVIRILLLKNEMQRAKKLAIALSLIILQIPMLPPELLFFAAPLAAPLYLAWLISIVRK